MTDETNLSAVSWNRDTLSTAPTVPSHVQPILGSHGTRLSPVVIEPHTVTVVHETSSFCRGRDRHIGVASCLFASLASAVSLSGPLFPFSLASCRQRAAKTVTSPTGAPPSLPSLLRLSPSRPSLCLPDSSAALPSSRMSDWTTSSWSWAGSLPLACPLRSHGARREAWAGTTRTSTRATLEL